MITIIKNLYRYVRNISIGEETILDKDKINLSLFLVMVVHFINAFFLGFYGNIGLCLFHIVMGLLYLAMSGIQNEQKYAIVTIVSCVEIVAASVVVCLMIGKEMGGNMLGFNLYCIAVIPAVFYICSSVKNFKKPTLFSMCVTLVCLVAFTFTMIYSGNIKEEPTHLPSALTTVIQIFNGFVTFFSLFIYSTLNSWESKNSTEMLTRRNEQLTQLSSRDPLTKLANRRSMMEKLNIAMSRLRNQNKPFCVILGDIDDFKKINDKYGHDCGDKVLTTVAAVIMKNIRENDFACRWGGEEILILIEGSIGSTDTIARRIWEDIGHAEVEHDGMKIKVTMTFGVAEAAMNLRLEDLIQQADNRLYYGKGHGKNQVVVSMPNGF